MLTPDNNRVLKLDLANVPAGTREIQLTVNLGSPNPEAPTSELDVPMFGGMQAQDTKANVELSRSKAMAESPNTNSGNMASIVGGLAVITAPLNIALSVLGFAEGAPVRGAVAAAGALVAISWLVFDSLNSRDSNANPESPKS